MKYRSSVGERVSYLAIVVFLTVLAITCVLPLINVLAMSFSTSKEVIAGNVFLWPREFTLSSYKKLYNEDIFFLAFLISLKRVILGTAVNVFFSVLLAYPLSKDPKEFKWRTLYVWYFFLPTLIPGGLIPTYLIITKMQLIDNIWALILPGAVPVWNAILLLNFIRGLPKEVEESAFIDGAGYMATMWRIIVPMSLPCIATITLFSIVGHWNSWFDGLIYMNSPKRFPLQTYLQSVNIELRGKWGDLAKADQEQMKMLQEVSSLTLKSARLFVTMLPVLCVYPFLQKYFTKGIVLGSVKS